ncbi:carbohydrate-binding module family 14 protein [Roseovarius sp. CAU 1744]|uniref:carbohydrate-binding module family 14 protein n=1 Tax=Roseovarius sp. CAU 1744 TaxID=3140368 RepID=UPI00325C2C69
MKLKIAIAAVVMTLGTAALAGPGCGLGHGKQVMSCGEGTVWDAQSQSCVPLTTS